MTSFSVVLTSIGRPTLTRMLESLVGQLDAIDFLYVLIDGEQFHDAVNAMLEPFKDKWKCQLIVKHHPTNLGFWGHGLKNHYQYDLQGDYILYGDDDDKYYDNAFAIIRENVTAPDMLYIFQMNNYGSLIPAHEKIEEGCIGGPCGVVANISSKFARWGYTYVGDCHFWQNTSHNFGSDKTKFVFLPIYHVR